jgi:hypothetical protein
MLPAFSRPLLAGLFVIRSSVYAKAIKPPIRQRLNEVVVIVNWAGVVAAYPTIIGPPPQSEFR